MEKMTQGTDDEEIVEFLALLESRGWFLIWENKGKFGAKVNVGVREQEIGDRMERLAEVMGMSYKRSDFEEEDDYGNKRPATVWRISLDGAAAVFGFLVEYRHRLEGPVRDQADITFEFCETFAFRKQRRVSEKELQRRYDLIARLRAIRGLPEKVPTGRVRKPKK